MLSKELKVTPYRTTYRLSAALLVVLAVIGCRFGTESVQLSDPRIQPLLKAMEQVDRAALGFTPVTTNADIRLELASGREYDAMLHVYGATGRTIAFRKTPSGYRWISEQENFTGPRWHQSVEGTFRESIVIEYQTERVNGIPTNQRYIRYSGGDTNLSDRELTLEEVRPVLDQWRVAPVEPRPPDAEWQHPEGFDPSFAMFVLFMLGALLVGCVLALILGVVCIAIAAVLLATGIVSASLLVGVLRRSVSAGFRALFIQLGAVVGMAGGAIATSAFTWIAKASWDSPLRWAAGVTIGLLIGILVAWLFNKVWTRIVQQLARKLERKGN